MTKRPVFWFVCCVLLAFGAANAIWLAMSLGGIWAPNLFVVYIGCAVGCVVCLVIGIQKATGGKL